MNTRLIRSAAIIVSAGLFTSTVELSAQLTLEHHNTRIVQGPGEIEVAVSDDGDQVIVVVNGVGSMDIPPVRKRIFFSDDRGTTFDPAAVPKNFDKSRDPTVAWTGPGKFYFATMGSKANVRVASSTDGGATFSAKTSLQCLGSKCSGDQPHMAGDRRPGQDQIYIVWRNKRPASNGRFYSSIGCSADGGNTWTRRTIERNVSVADRRADFPRLTVGPDGFAYVVMADADHDSNLVLQRFSPCSDGLQPFWTDSNGKSAPSRIGHFVGVKCESGNTIAGLDRCNHGLDIMASPTVAVDDTDGRRVYVTYADEVSQGNHDIVLLTTSDVTALQRDEAFGSRRIINQVHSGERFMPWSCTTQGFHFAGWYDRRSRTAAHNDNTEYFVGINSAGLETDTSDGIDPQCSSGWPGGGGRAESGACSSQPQFAGLCLSSSTASPVPSTPRCDYTNGGCPSGLQCIEPRKGRGKYGDYNGIACANGSAYVAWASAKPPTGQPNIIGLQVFFSRVDLVRLPPPPPPSAECQACKRTRDECLADADRPQQRHRCYQRYDSCRALHCR